MPISLFSLVATLLALPAVTLTVYAVVSAKEGYEDDNGFHSLVQNDSQSSVGINRSGARRRQIGTLWNLLRNALRVSGR